MILENLGLALRSLWAHKMRSFLTTLGIIIGVGAVITVVSLVQGFSQVITREIEGLGANSIIVEPNRPPGKEGEKLARVEMTLEDGEAVLAASRYVDAVAPLVQNFEKVKSGEEVAQYPVLGTTPIFQDLRNYYVEQGRFFAVEGASRDDYAQKRSERLNEPSSLGLLRRAHVKFEIAGHCDALRQAAKRVKAFGVDVALCENASDLAENRTPEAAKHLVARPRTVGDACIDYCYGNLAAKAAVEQVGPEFCLREDQQYGPESIEIGTDCPGKVQRTIENPVRPEPFTGERMAGARGGRDQQSMIGKSRTQFLNQPARGQHLTHRDGMQPDRGPLAWRIAQMLWHATETLRKPLAIFAGFGHSPKPPGSPGTKGCQQREVVEKENHTRRISTSPGLTLK